MKANQKGFTLIEVLMAVGLSTMVIMGLMYTSKMMLDIKKNNDQNFEVASVMGEISIALNKEPICSSFNLDQVLFDPTSSLQLSQIKVNASDIILAINDKISHTLTIKSIFVDEFQAAQSNATHTDYLANLNIEIERESGIGSKQIIKKLPINILAENISPTQAKAIKCRTNNSIIDDNNLLGNNLLTPVNFQQSTCALFGGTFNADTGLCEGTTVNMAANMVPNHQLRCGYCLKKGMQIDQPCMGQSLCSLSATCPTGFQLVHLQGAATSVGGGTEKYCQPLVASP